VSSSRMKIRCPNCQKDGSVRAELLNRRVSCKHCTHVFRVVPIDDDVAVPVAPAKVQVPPPAQSPGSPARPSDDRIEALELEVRRLRDDLAAERAEAGKLPSLRDQLVQALDAARKAEGRERSLREEVGRLRDQAEQADHGTGGDSRDRLREEELKFLRDQLDKARAEVESESRKRREAAASLTLRIAEHARAVETQAADHAGVLSQAQTLRDELGRTKGELEAASRALDALRLDRDRIEADHARVLDGLRGQLAGLEARLGDLDATRLDRDRLAGELEAQRSRLAEADRSSLEHKAAAESLRLGRDRLELEAARAGRLDVEAALLERDEALALRDRAIEALETLRARMDAQGESGEWNDPSTELEVPNAQVDLPTEADLPTITPELSTVFGGGPEPRQVGPELATCFEESAHPLDLDHDQARASAIEAESLRLELEQARAEAEAANRRNLELVDRIRDLEASSPAPAPASTSAVDPVWIEAERKRAVDEAVKGAWTDFERRLSETQAKLRAANARADLMEMEAREAREQAARDLGDDSSFDEPHSMTSIRILDARGTSRLTPADAEARLALARQVAVDRKDKTLIDRIGKMAEKVRADLDARNYTLAETLVRGAEIETGIDAGGLSIGGLRIFRPSPTIVGSLTALAPAFDRAIRQGDPSTIRSTIDEMRTILGDQAGLPEIRRVGRKPATKRPIVPSDALRLFVAAIEAENWLIRPIAARKPPPDTSLTTYAGLVEACVRAREAAQEHAPDRLGLLDSVIQASALMLARRQQPDGHFSFLDPRGKASKSASVVEAMAAQRPDSIKDGWVVLVDPIGLAQAETGACGLALATAGKALERPDWTLAARKAADWAMGQPCLPNFVANAASASLLARAYRDAGKETDLAGLATKLTLGLLPGQVENGRWIDASSAATPNHILILRALHDAWEVIPPGREDIRRALKPAIDRAMSSLLDECKALGFALQGNPLPDLLRHRDLPGLAADPRLEPAILDAATVIQELCHDGPKPKLGVAPEQLAALIRI
jgi:hypothetical protein